ncbi:MAG: YciI family protein [Bacteroidota bacterium]
MKRLAFALILIASVPALAQQQNYIFVFLNRKPDVEKLPKEQIDKIMAGHLANIERLAKEKKLIVAGPFDGGGGIFILNTTSAEEAKGWLSTDPGIQANRWNIEMLPYKPRVGGACSAPEPYEMVSYSFIRFDAVVSKFTASTYPQIVKKHNEYLKQLEATGNVITEGIFGEHDGGILIMKGEVQRDIFESDPGVQEGLMELSIRKLWIAKGSFCEK